MNHSSFQGLDFWLRVLQGEQLRELHDGVPQRVHLARNQRRQEKGKTRKLPLWRIDHFQASTFPANEFKLTFSVQSGLFHL